MPPVEISHEAMHMCTAYPVQQAQCSQATFPGGS